MTKPVVAPEEKAVVEAAEPIEKEAIKPATLLKAPIKKIEAKTKKQLGKIKVTLPKPTMKKEAAAPKKAP